MEFLKILLMRHSKHPVKSLNLVIIRNDWLDFGLKLAPQAAIQDLNKRFYIKKLQKIDI